MDRESSKTEDFYKSPEERFKSQIEERYNTWIEVVDESDIEEDLKKEVRQVLDKFRNSTFTLSLRIEDAFYNSVNHILTITNKSKEVEDARALFENIRDDIWDFFNKEINK